MPKVSQFSSAFTKTPSPPVELMAILSAIKNGKWKLQVEKLHSLKGKAFDEAKKKLTAFTATGVFSRHNDAGFEEHSGFIQVDVDGKDNPDLTYSKLWNHVKECPHTYAAFRSPSGRGVKILVKCPPDKSQHTGSYKAALQWFADKGVTVDSKVCALSQLCFISYDPDLFLNSKPRQITPLDIENTEHALIEFEEHRSKEEILEACESQSQMFRDLWEGDYQLHTDDHSVADHQLICLLRDNCHSNEMVAEMFAESGLYRPEKWKGRTRDYVFQTLRKSSVISSLSLLTALPDDDDDPTPKKKKKATGWSWETVSDIPEWQAEDDHYIIKHLLHEVTTSCVYGAPGSGKTFLVFSLCAAIASGRVWNGYKVRQGGVLYFGLEGRHGVRKRIQAMKKEGQLSDGDPFGNVHCAEESLNLLSEEHVDKICEMVKAFESETGHKCKVIVVDTLARATPGGDENSTKDMGQVLINAQRVADRTGCCVLIIHHSGKDSSRGMRGSTALPGGFDAIYEVSRLEEEPSFRACKIRKQRDEADSRDMFFKLNIITLGVDLDLEPVTTCLVQFLEEKDIPLKKEKGQMEADHLLSLIPPDGVAFEDLMRGTGLSRTTLQRRLNVLVADFTIRRDGNKYLRIFDETPDDDPSVV